MSELPDERIESFESSVFMAASMLAHAGKMRQSGEITSLQFEIEATSRINFLSVALEARVNQIAAGRFPKTE